MKVLDRFRRRDARVLVIGLDGTPYTFAREAVFAGTMPNFGRALDRGQMIPMRSVLPTVSCVAWSSFMTGRTPGQHGIYGFVDRRPDSYKIHVTTSRHLKAEPLWEMLSRAGKRVIVVNVPATYPPREVNGILISGFETPDLAKGVYPPSLVPRLQALRYRIDIDAWQARESRDALMEDLHRTLERRVETLLTLLDQEPWDFFIGVLMETDRIHHFLWEHMETGHSRFRPAFMDYYRRIDDFLGQVLERVDDRTTLIVLSDHGFCTLRREVYVNAWLVQQGWLRFQRTPPQSLEDIDPAARAYSLDPGRIYLNLKGREPGGTVEPGDAERLLTELGAALRKMADPETGEPMVEAVYRPEEIYSRPPYQGQPPDLVILSRNGYEMKGAVDKSVLTGRDAIEGMHTTDNAMLYISTGGLRKAQAEITDVLPTILTLMRVPVPPGVDGQSLLEGA